MWHLQLFFLAAMAVFLVSVGSISASRADDVQAVQEPRNACETLKDWGVMDMTGKMTQDGLAITKEPGPSKTVKPTLEWKLVREKNVYKALARPVVLTDLNLLEVDLWSKEGGVLAITFDDTDGASFHYPVELKPGEWNHVKITPPDFKLSDGSPVKKSSLDPKKITPGFAIVDMAPFLGAAGPNTFRFGSLNIQRKI